MTAFRLLAMAVILVLTFVLATVQKIKLKYNTAVPA